MRTIKEGKIDEIEREREEEEEEEEEPKWCNNYSCSHRHIKHIHYLVNAIPEIIFEQSMLQKRRL